MHASRAGRDSIVSLLLESKAEINAMDSHGVCLNYLFHVSIQMMFLFECSGLHFTKHAYITRNRLQSY